MILHVGTAVGHLSEAATESASDAAITPSDNPLGISRKLLNKSLAPKKMRIAATWPETQLHMFARKGRVIRPGTIIRLLAS
jgi:hypothetical protein